MIGWNLKQFAICLTQNEEFGKNLNSSLHGVVSGSGCITRWPDAVLVSENNRARIGKPPWPAEGGNSRITGRDVLQNRRRPLPVPGRALPSGGNGYQAQSLLQLPRKLHDMAKPPARDRRWIWSAALIRNLVNLLRRRPLKTSNPIKV